MTGRSPRVVGIIQARMGSTRLPGKVLADLAGKALIQWLIERISISTSLDLLVVATSTETRDDPLADCTRSLGVALYRGSELDVLDRYYQAAKEFRADMVVRLTADNPLVAGPFVDQCVESFLGARPAPDYLDTTSSRTFPYGLAVEVFSFAALHEAWSKADLPGDREHVTPYLRRPENSFQVMELKDESGNGDLRWTVDTPEDLTSMRDLFARCSPQAPPTSYTELLALARSAR